MLQPSEPFDNDSILPPAVLGVFAYLDQVLPAVMHDRIATEDVGVGPGDAKGAKHDLRDQVRSLVRQSFPLKDYNAPLCQDLEAFRLYHSWDKADALTAAYGLKARGLDPLPALTADYAIRSGGILRWADERELQAEAANDPGHSYRSIHRYIRKGDRIAHYSLPTSLGLMLVRGDRLVCTIQTLHMSLEGDTGEEWKRRVAEWEAEGGYNGFLASPLADEKSASTT